MNTSDFQEYVVAKLDKIETRLVPVEKHVLVVNSLLKIVTGGAVFILTLIKISQALGH